MAAMAIRYALPPGVRTLLVAMLGVCALAGCAGSGPVIYEPGGPVADLIVSLADGAWDGRTIPKEGICKQGTGGGMSPAILVGGIPPRADAVVVEFNDTGRHDLAEYGGHGAIWVATGGATEVLVPSVHERTFTLPDGVQAEHGHRAGGFGPGAYLAPCSLGQGHLYVAHIMAVQKNAGGTPRLLAEGDLSLGVY